MMEECKLWKNEEEHENIGERKRFMNSLLQDSPDTLNMGEPYTSLQMVIDMVETKNVVVLYNEYNIYRVFYMGNIKEIELSKTRVIAIKTGLSGLLDDGEWNWYIENTLDIKEILDKEMREMTRNYINNKKQNVHFIMA